MKTKSILFENIDFINYIIDEIKSIWDEFQKINKNDSQKKQEIFENISTLISTLAYKAGKIDLIENSINLSQGEKNDIDLIIKFKLNTYLQMLYDKDYINEKTISCLESSFYALLEYCKKHHIQILTHKDKSIN